MVDRTVLEGEGGREGGREGGEREGGREGRRREGGRHRERTCMYHMHVLAETYNAQYYMYYTYKLTCFSNTL